MDLSFLDSFFQGLADNTVLREIETNSKCLTATGTTETRFSLTKD